MSEITRADAVRSVSQGVPPRTPESSTPMYPEPRSKTRIGIVREAVKKQIPPSSPSEERRPVGEITKPDDWKEYPATRKRLTI